MGASLVLSGCFAAPPQIVALIPPDGSTHLDADTPVEVFFDQAVRPASVAASFDICAGANGCQSGLPGCSDLASAFQAAPSAACWVSWLSDHSGFVFHHHGPALFAPNTKYEFSLRAGVASTAGTVNSLDHVWNLTSAPAPTLTSSTPGSGQTGFPRDGAISLSFSHPMKASALAAAVSLSPAAPGVRVIADPKDPASFEVVPRQPLAPDTDYTMRLSRKATDAHGQPLAREISIRFRTGALAAGSQALVLAGRQGEGATEVLLAPLSTAPTSLPIPAEVVAQAPPCRAAAGCEGAPQGGATASFEQAAISPGSLWLALVETDPATPQSTQLHILDLASGHEQIAFQSAQWPSWSPDGSTLAFVSGGREVELYQPGSGSLTSLMSGLPPSGTPVWTGSGDTLAIPVAAKDGSVARIDLATPALDARYPLPGLTGAASRIVAAPSGQEIAVALQPPGGSTTTWVAKPAGSRAPQHLAAAALPVGFVDSATLIAVERSASGASQLVRIDLGSGATAPLAAPKLHPDLNTAAVAPDGRQIAYLATAGAGQAEAIVANADGTGALPIVLPESGLVPIAISLGA